MKKDTALKIVIAMVIAGLQIWSQSLGKRKPSRRTIIERKQK